MLALFFVFGNLWTTLNRSTVPLSFDGVVTDVELREEKHPGVDDVYILYLGSDAFVIDSEVASQIKTGDRVQKDAWSTDLRVNGESVTLGTSRDFEGMVIAMPLIMAAILFTLKGRSSHIESEGGPPGEVAKPHLGDPPGISSHLGKGVG